MSATSKIALGVAGGYLLGRTKKFKLAITLGSMLAGQRIATDRAGMLRQGAAARRQQPRARPRFATRSWASSCSPLAPPP